jgi:hypothetical protein
MTQQQRISIAAHEAWRVQMARLASKLQPDTIDELEADPIHDHAPAYKSNKSTSRLLGILDEIERGNG